MLACGGAKTFFVYAAQAFLLCITSQPVRVAVAWDEHLPGSVEADTRTKKDAGTQRRVEASYSIPGDWQAFLQPDEDWAELFSFLATRQSTLAAEQQVTSTLHKDVFVSLAETSLVFYMYT